MFFAAKRKSGAKRAKAGAFFIGKMLCERDGERKIGKVYKKL